MTQLVFVYGTLKSGYWNHALLQDAKFISTGVTEDDFLMADGGFPVVYREDDERFLDHKDKAGMIVGELYEVDEQQLDNLDGLEGHPDWYERRLVSVLDEDSATAVQAWMYLGENVTRPPEMLISPTENFLLEWKAA